MLVNIVKNRVVVWIVAAAAIYAILFWTVPPAPLIIIFNGIFVGVMVSLSIAYFNLIKYSILNTYDFDRSNQFALGVAIAWLVIVIGIFNSVYVRSSESSVAGSDLTALIRYLAIFAAVVQVTALDFGQNIFYGRDRRLLLIGGIAGLIVAILVIYFQAG